MKPKKSELNPFAASYVPFSKVETGVSYEASGVTRKAYPSRSQTVWSQYAVHNMQQQQQQQQQHYEAPANSFYGSSSQSSSQFPKRTGDDEFYVHLDYLRSTFPDVSDESLTDVYVANRGDIEATIDMLHELESFSIDDSFESLPETLGIGDIPETGSSVEASSGKPTNVTGEASSSSSKPLDSDHVC